MKEDVYNLFLYTDDAIFVKEYGVSVHTFYGTDEEKSEYLKSHVITDFESAQKFKIPNRFKMIQVNGDEISGCMRIDSAFQSLNIAGAAFFSEAMIKLNAPAEPLYVCTVIENGKPVGIMNTKKSKFNGNTMNAFLRRGIDTKLSKELIDKGYNLSKLKQLKNSELSNLGLNDDQILSINEGGRPPIPSETYIKLLYESKRTCCVCRDATKPIIIHHIEEWSQSKSHDESNLVVLCLEHHDLAHTKKELSIDLSKKQLREFKTKWIEDAKTSDAEAILGLVSHDYSRWDYFNHRRIYELFLDLNINAENFKTFSKLKDAGYVDDLGILEISTVQKMNENRRYMYDDGNGFILVYYMKEVFESVLANLPIINITDKFDRAQINSLLRPGSFIAFQAGFYYKNINTSLSGTDQLRRAHYKKKGIKIEFTFPPFEATSSSSHSDSLTGHSVSTVICIVKSIYDKDDYLNIDVSCLAIGSYFENCRFKQDKRF
ncbi:HNH endonuclease signature motif containing protein [Thiomicrorhabdus xiamenensis]|uniref:HNH endonuclease n=1 Tax=Thiomicrorhabdus xiamenensis TaxID=2739063 RepID=A0A7D4NQK1_9GAMM|nr:HNH endonuclease signature motif containing protein [Thiomicrorhabdus xiamenensis]QKI88897.1 HNH endonuclease [Thiomicrorhabdus xiamenensis]